MTPVHWGVWLALWLGGAAVMAHAYGETLLGLTLALIGLGVAAIIAVRQP